MFVLTVFRSLDNVFASKMFTSPLQLKLSPRWCSFYHPPGKVLLIPPDTSILISLPSAESGWVTMDFLPNFLLHRQWCCTRSKCITDVKITLAWPIKLNTFTVEKETQSFSIYFAKRPKKVGHTFNILQQMLQNVYSMSDNFGTLWITEFKTVAAWIKK